MPADEKYNGLVARIAALEVISGSALTFLFASAGNDPDLSKAKALLDVIRHDGEKGFAHLPESIRNEANAYLSNLLSQVMSNLPALRGAHTQKSN